MLGLITGSRGGCGEPALPGRGGLGRDRPSQPLPLGLVMLRAARGSGQAGERRQERTGAGRQEGAGRREEAESGRRGQVGTGSVSGRSNLEGAGGQHVGEGQAP